MLVLADFGHQSKRKTGLILALVLLTVVSVLPAWAFDRQTPVVQAVQKVGPAVVNISSEYQVHNRPNPFGGNPLFDNFFRDFFEQQPQKRVSLGSGVIIDGRRGFILTNAHVIERSTSIKVTLQDERQFDVRIVGADPDSDLAVLQINTDTALPAIEMGNSDDIMIGETIIAIGNPFGFSHTVTTGVVSAVNRSINTDDRVFHDFIQTDASINPGNSGGPLLNINGELIGINTAIYAKAQGIGFAIPINKAKRIIADLIQYGHVMQAWIGLVVQDLDSRMAAYLGLQNVNGVVVTQVEEDSPAARAGLESGDLITAMGRRNITSVDDYYAVVRSLSTGETVEFSILRDAVGKRISIKTRTYPRERAAELAWRRLGVKVQAVDRRMRRQFRILSDRGVVITEVREGSHLSHIGVAAGDVIVQLDDQTIGTLDEFSDAVIKSRLKASVLLLVQRDDRVYYLTVRLSP